jgi:seryl-tRNA synthetase
MTALRREVNCLQDQRRLLQMKITSNSAFVGDKDAFDRSINDYKRDVLEKLQREYGERIERERRPLEDTIKELRREVDDLRRERNEIRSTFRHEKVQSGSFETNVVPRAICAILGANGPGDEVDLKHNSSCPKNLAFQRWWICIVWIMWN